MQLIMTRATCVPSMTQGKRTPKQSYRNTYIDLDHAANTGWCWLGLDEVLLAIRRARSCIGTDENYSALR